MEGLKTCPKCKRAKQRDAFGKKRAMVDVFESDKIERMKKFPIEHAEMSSPTKQVRERQKLLEKVRKESEQKRIAREIAALKHEDNKWWIDKIQWAIGIGVAVLIGWEPLSNLFAYLNL